MRKFITLKQTDIKEIESMLIHVSKGLIMKRYGISTQYPRKRK